jgi:DUF4097 and DUF4098 domain-containing protein YvlB
MTTFETPGNVRVRVAIGSGDVRIDVGSEPRTEVELVALRDDDATHAAITEAVVEARERGDRTEVVVELPRKGGWSFLGRGPSIGVRVRCPEGAEVEVASASADVTTTGRLGDAEVKTASGDVAVDVVAGLRVSTASGDVTAREVTGEGNVKTASGDVSVRLSHDSLSLNLASGDAVVGEAKGPLSIATVSGDQEVGSVETGQIKLQSVSGDVRVGVRPGLKVWIDATSVSGSMISELAMGGDTVGEGDAQVELRARTVSGDVRVVPATVVEAP